MAFQFMLSEGMVLQLWEGMVTWVCGNRPHCVHSHEATQGQLQDLSLRDNTSTFDYPRLNFHEDTFTDTGGFSMLTINLVKLTMKISCLTLANTPNTAIFKGIYYHP